MRSLEKQTANEKYSFGLLLTGMGMLGVYGFIKNPLHYTISMTGIDYPIMFFFVCVAIGTACLTNAMLFLKKTDIDSRILKILVFCANIAMFIVPFTNEQGYHPFVTQIHWISAFLYMILNPILILVCAVMKIRQGQKRYIYMLAVFLPAYLADVVYMIIAFSQSGAMGGKNGVLELIPIYLTFILFFLLNHTTIFENDSRSVDNSSASMYNQFETNTERLDAENEQILGKNKKIN